MVDVIQYCCYICTMSTSLKSLLPALSDALGDSEAALYERQRALVRAGLLEFVPGHGPGSGVRATPESISVLLIGMLATMSLSEAADKAREIMSAQAAHGGCPLTGATTFKDALAAILSKERLAKRITELRVTATHGLAEIVYGRTGKSVFTGSMPDLPPGIQVTIRDEKSMFTGPTSDLPGMRITIAFGPKILLALAKIVAELPT